MNTQLQLINTNNLNIRENSKHRHNYRTHTNNDSSQQQFRNSTPIWKLTNEERQIGLTQIRAIRAILKNPSGKPSNQLAQAS